ncbi:helix-turn-helix domain-containing protein [Halosimplex sp. TS25]|uniref:helix-turn-helix domain-containing protein n=1 Tax=Halosimplex rarum TaxID=3396619 RepID=UPI0039E916E1
MAKYSTGGAGSSASDSCELCGAENVDLQTASVAGATLSVCSECAHHDETSSKASGSDDDGDRKRRAAQNAARLQDANAPDAEHWEDGADYDDDQLPYLVSDYGDVLVEARQDAGLQTAELADAVGADESDVLAVEQGRATQANVGGSLIAALEAELDLQLVDSN